MIVSAPAVPGPLDVGFARAVTETKATSFALACRLLPLALRDDVYRLYLVFRTLDDLVDGGDARASSRVAAVREWAEATVGPRTDEVATLETLSQRYPIPRHAIADFCRGMEQDLTGESFASERDLDRYCYRVAGTVGLVMTALLGAEELEEAETCAAALGIAMQRTNILRDIDEDTAAGRMYIPAETLQRYGGSLAPADRGELVRDLIARTDDLYAEGLAGVPLLRSGRFAIRLAAGLYREILREIERRQSCRLAGRAVVSPRRKLLVAAGAVLAVR